MDCLGFLDYHALLADCRVRAWRELAASIGMQTEGLSQAARIAKRAGTISSGMCREMVNLDVSFHFSKHVSRQNNMDFLRRLAADMEACRLGVGAQRPSTAGKPKCKEPTTRKLTDFGFIRAPGPVSAPAVDVQCKRTLRLQASDASTRESEHGIRTSDEMHKKAEDEVEDEDEQMMGMRKSG